MVYFLLIFDKRIQISFAPRNKCSMELTRGEDPDRTYVQQQKGAIVKG